MRIHFLEVNRLIEFLQILGLTDSKITFRELSGAVMKKNARMINSC